VCRGGEKERKMDHSEYQPWAQRLKTKVENAEYRLEKLRRERGRLVGSKSPPEDLHWRIWRRDRLMELAWQNIAEIDESMFAIDVLRDLEEIRTLAPTDEEAAN
jgi:hypothetical protein